MIVGHTNIDNDVPRENGLHCPECQGVLLDVHPNTILTSDPPMKEVKCLICDYKGYRILVD